MRISILLLFIFELSLASTQLIGPKSLTAKDAYGTWKSACRRAGKFYGRTFTSIRRKKTVIYRVKYEDSKCQKPAMVLRIKGQSHITAKKRMLPYTVNYREVSASCYSKMSCLRMSEKKSMGIAIWRPMRWVSAEVGFGRLVGSTLYTTLVVSKNSLYYGDRNEYYTGQSDSRRPASIDDSQFDIRISHLPVFLSTIR